MGACGNVFSHELGHSFSLSHFTDSDQCQGRLPASHTAEQCIAEYPDGGYSSAKLPWGFDTNRQALRTWYQVDGFGPVYGDPLPSD